MKDPIRSAIEINLPLLIGLVLGLYIWFGDRVGIEFIVDMLNERFGLPLTEVNVTNPRLAKVGLITVDIAVVTAIMMRRDYTPFYPENLTFMVAFDRQGLAAALSKIPKSERQRLSIADNESWPELQDIYLEKLNLIMRSRKYPEYAYIDNNMQAQGRFWFEAHRVSEYLQAYMIRGAEGQVVFNFSRDQGMPLRSRFQQYNTPRDRIHVKWHQFFTPPWCAIVALSFDQYVEMDGMQRLTIDRMTSPTRIRYWPWIEIGPTVYLVDYATIPNVPKTNGRLLVPVAYAEY